MAPNKAVKLYGWAVSPFMARALVCLEEAGMDYELVPMSRDAGDHRRPDHLARTRNPFGQVPVLEDGDLTLFGNKPSIAFSSSDQFRSVTNLRFNCELVWFEVKFRRTKKHFFSRIPRDCQARSPQVQAGAPGRRQPGAVGHGGRVAGRGGAPAPPGGGRHRDGVPRHAPVGGARDQAAVDENAGKLRAVLGAYEARLARSRHLAGDAVSVADLSHFPLMRYLMATEYAAMVEALPHVSAWWEDLAARPPARKVAELMPLDLGLSRKHEQ